MNARRVAGLVGAAALGLLAAPGGCGPYGPGSGTTLLGGGKVAERVAFAASRPGAIAAAPDGRVFFTEKSTGRIRVISGGVLQPTPFAEVAVNNANDRGLLGVALHPQFAINNRVYAFYSRSSSGANTGDQSAIVDHRVVYFTANGDTADGGEVFVASFTAIGDGRRVGGRIAFARDGALIVALGDQGDESTALDAASRSGKILRFTDIGGIPADNPTTGSPVVARGVRHPQGLAVDPLSAGVFFVDRNEGGLHEINRLVFGGNYGWPSVAGLANTAADQSFVAANPDYVDPLLDTGPSSATITGASFNPSAKYGPSTELGLFYGRTTDLQVAAASLNGARDAITGSSVFTDAAPNVIADLTFTPAGTLYFATNEAVYRVMAE